MTNKKSKPRSTQKNIALCYVRQSYTRDENDMNSPERQRANIQLVCNKYGWIPEWYEDADGHRSGRDIKNRPGWLALSQRIGDGDVIALVANDLARLHRKGWRVGDMLDHLERHGIALVLAAPGREVDTSTPQGKMFVQFTAMLDEYYAEDISQRSKDSIAYRKSLGKKIGQPPYGTLKKDGYLIKSHEGAWLLPDGRFVAGKPDKMPEQGAIWRSYYEGAERILSLYAEGNMGLERIAYQMNSEGIPFRARHNRPRNITQDDVRRVVSNWGTYGGLTMSQRSIDRKAYEAINPDEIVFDEERAVFPIDLLRKVAKVRHQRSIRPLDDGKPRRAKFYPLSQITYCAHCEALAAQHNDPKYRSTLTGTFLNGKSSYRHKLGLKCTCQRRTVRCEILEQDFARLIKLLTVSPEMLDVMSTLAFEADRAMRKDSDVDPQKEKEEAIALCKRRIQAAVNLYGDGMIDREEYNRRKELNEREMAYWQARTTESEQAALELSMCLDAIDTISRLWDISDDEDRQGMVRNLFSYIVYDLDTQRITDFRLKAWADRFLVLRSALYEVEKEDVSNKVTQRGMLLMGVKPISRPQIRSAVFDLLDYFFGALSARQTSKTALAARNGHIMGRFAAGETIDELAKAFGLTYQRVYQIVRSQ